jgi:hypothetical protein
MASAADPNLELLQEAATRLEDLLDELVLVGGCAAGLLVTDPGSSPIRPTEDVDLEVEAATYVVYDHFGRRLTRLGFRPGTEPGDPLCRWRHGTLTLDVMPLDESVLGFSNRWYRLAVRAPSSHRLPGGTTIRHIDAPHFLATKLAAFASRGKGDYLTSADLEDVVVVIDGRPTIEQELDAADGALRTFVSNELGALLRTPYFLEALPGYFGGGSPEGTRLKATVERLHRMAQPDPA